MTDDNSSSAAAGRRYRETGDIFQAVKAAEAVLKAADEVNSLYSVHVPAMRKAVINASMADVCNEVISCIFTSDSSTLPEKQHIKTLGAICIDEFSKGEEITLPDGKTERFFERYERDYDSSSADDIFFEYKSIHAAKYFKDNIKPVCGCNPLYSPLNDIEENHPLLNRALGILYLAESYEMREKNGMTDKISGLKPAAGYFVPFGAKYSDGFRLAAAGIMTEAEEYLKGRGFTDEAEEILQLRAGIFISKENIPTPVVYAENAINEHKRMTRRYNENSFCEKILYNNENWLNKIRFCRDIIRDGAAAFQNINAPAAKP